MKKGITIFLTAVLLLGLLSGCGNAAQTGNEQDTTAAKEEYVIRELPETESIEPAAAFAGGSGTENDPYQIADAAQLALMAKQVQEDTAYAVAHYVLTGDISLNDTAEIEKWGSSGKNSLSGTYSWEPIGRTGNDFSGVFDGNGYTVSGMYINTDANLTESYHEKNYGLFGTVAGTVKNLTVENSRIYVTGETTSSSFVGGIAGNVTADGVIEDCVSRVNIVECDANCGGIAGSISGGLVVGIDYEEGEEPGYSRIEGCVFEGSITRTAQGDTCYLGGIVGSGDGHIADCVNGGNLTFTGDSADSVGGIIGFFGDGSITNCENAGYLSGIITHYGGESSVGARVGGIVGNLFLSNVGSEKYMSRGVTVENCQNSGHVSGVMYAGGIAGNVSNDHNDWCVTISECENSGVVTSMGYTGGIIGRLSCTGDDDHGENVLIERCRNTVDIRDETVGGIIGQLVSETGRMMIRGCSNSGDLVSEGQNCGGIIGYWIMGSTADTETAILNCTNSGNVESNLNAGGIVSFADAPVLLEVSEDTTVSFSGCTNSGTVSTREENGYVGGIAGNLGFATIPTLLDDCVNTGNIIMNNHAPDQETLNSDKIFTISRICGGIVGRVGPGLLLTTDSDEVDLAYLNTVNALVRITNCYSSGLVLAEYPQEYTNADGESVFVNYFGGIVGNWCGEEEYSLLVQDCGYANMERGMGNTELPDVGQKVPESQIKP